MHEALAVSLPLVVIPIIGYQMANADRVAKCGAGFSFRHPLETLSVPTLSEALQKLFTLDSFRLAASCLAEEINEAGGVPAAVNAILGCVKEL